MIGIIFSLFCLSGLAVGAIQGEPGAVCNAAMEGASQAVSLSIALCGSMCLWNGIMCVAQEAGLTDLLARLLGPVLCRLFPDAYQKKKGVREISLAFAGNMLGIGNAATPLAIRAMEKLQENNPSPDTASDDMVLFAVMSTAPVNLLPGTLIALRQAFGARDPFSVVLPVMVSSSLCCIASVVFCLACRTIGRALRFGT